MNRLKPDPITHMPAARKPAARRSGTAAALAPSAPPRPKVPELIASQIRQLIADSELKEDDELGSEADLIARYDASRPSVREAIRILEAEGLVKIVKGARSVKVREPRPDLPARFGALFLRAQGCGIADAYRARTLIEPAAIRELIGRVSDAEIAALDRIVAEEVKAAVADPDQFSALTVRFHEEIARLSGNKVIHLLLTMMRSMFENHARDAISSDSSDNFKRAIKSHMILIHLIRRRKADEAEAFWKRHLQIVERIMSRSPGFDELVEFNFD